MEGVGDRDQTKVTPARVNVLRARLHLADVCGRNELVEHLLLGVDGDELRGVRRQRHGDLARPAAEVEQSPRPVEARGPGDEPNQLLRVTGPEARVVPGCPSKE